MRKVLITGSTQGIGLATAKQMVQEGYQVFVHCSKDQEKADKVCKEIGAYKGVVADLSDLEETKALYQKTGALDCLILNASVQYKSFWLDITDEEIEKQLNVNVRSTLKLMQAYYPGMQQQKFGRIITIGSVNQYNNHQELSLYGATKCAVYHLVENVAKYSAAYGVTVNNVAPGAIATPRNQAVQDNPELMKAVESKIPMGRFGKAEEVASVVCMLCKEESSYITGADIVIDGGMRL